MKWFQVRFRLGRLDTMVQQLAALRRVSKPAASWKTAQAGHAHSLPFYGQHFRKGFSLEEIQGMLGHSSRITTETYAKLTFTPEIRDRYLQLFEGGAYKTPFRSRLARPVR